ncbi:hypothetical protein RIF29_16931 [Crotalaria pallida]|uniref:RING-type E3 ubiquitin transferase n=1 Tax=Crotalaria pallida TaxID=3830 RepID=A0AAN9FG41_CROPI
MMISSFPFGCHAFISLFLLLLFLLTSSPATAQFVEAQPLDPNTNNKSSVFAVMAIVVVMFFVSGFVSLCSRQCSGGRTRTLSRINLALPTGDSDGRSRREPRGLDQEIIDTFPTFLYSNVKGLKIGKETLVCAVCINEFEDDETLRLIPKCNHVFHPSCIDVWLSSHSTCPVCRANLVPRPEDTPPMVPIQIPNEEAIVIVEEEGIKTENNNDTEASNHVFLKRSHTMNHNRLPRSRSTDFLFNVLFPRRSNSMGRHHSEENFERFTLRLPDEMLMLNTTVLKRTNSCMSFRRMSSGRKGYRTRSFSSGGSEEQWRFSLTTPFFGMNNWNRSGRKSYFQGTRVVLDDDNNVGERSSDLLCPK